MIYCDSSALVKLVAVEAESTALAARLGREDLVTSGLARAETLRAIARASLDPARRAAMAARAEELLDGMYVLAVTDEILRAAGRLEPPTLRTLDAIHLASALLVRDELSAFVTYDTRQSTAATVVGIPTAAPG